VLNKSEKCLAKRIMVYYNVYNEVYMRTNIVLNDELVDEAFQFSGTISTKRELIETALKEYVNNRKRKNIRELKGKIRFKDGYDHKMMRN
jgi:Arc/MetJ family transcription regulator